MVSWKSQAGYTTRSLPLLQTPFFSNVCIVGMRLYSLHVPPTFSWKSRWALEARSFLSESRKLNYIVILNAQRPPVAWKKNLSWFQCLPLSESCNLAKWRDTLFETCAMYFHFRVLSELLTLLYNVLLLTWQVARFVVTIQQPCLKCAWVTTTTILWWGWVSLADRL